MDESLVNQGSLEQVRARAIEKALVGGDLSGLTTEQRNEYYQAVCKSLGLNPLTKPFEYLNLNGKLRLYALRDCADQLRRLHGISIYIANRERVSDIYVVTARAKDRSGREDESTGAVPLKGLVGDALANALMKAETKAKRRVTLSIAGLGFLDEVEVDSIPGVVTGESESPRVVVGHESLDQSAQAPTSPYDTSPTADQISALVDIARACGVDLVSFGHHMRRLMNWSQEVKVTKKYLREHMHMNDFEIAWQHYNDLLKQQVEASVATGELVESDATDPDASVDDGGEDVADFSAPETPQDVSPAPDNGSPSPAGDRAAERPPDGTYATPTQIHAMRNLAQQVDQLEQKTEGPKAVEDVSDLLAHHPEGIEVGIYEIIMQRLRARVAKAPAKPAAKVAS